MSEIKWKNCRPHNICSRVSLTLTLSKWLKNRHDNDDRLNVTVDVGGVCNSVLPVRTRWKFSTTKECRPTTKYRVSIRCQFHHHFTYELHHFGSFFYVHVTREKLPKRRLYKKFVHKMLMKLTKGKSGKVTFRNREPSTPDHGGRRRGLLDVGRRKATIWSLEGGRSPFIFRRIRFALSAQNSFASHTITAPFLEPTNCKMLNMLISTFQFSRFWTWLFTSPQSSVHVHPLPHLLIYLFQMTK